MISVVIFVPFTFFTIINSLSIIIVLHWNILYHNCLSKNILIFIKVPNLSLLIIILWIEIVPDILQKMFSTIQLNMWNFLLTFNILNITWKCKWRYDIAQDLYTILKVKSKKEKSFSCKEEIRTFSCQHSFTVGK